MKIEYELKILDIDPREMKLKLHKLWAQEYPIKEFKRSIYDFHPASPNKWIRLRTDGDKTTLTIKDRQADAVDGTKELEIQVSSFQDSNLILQELGYTPRLYQENRRSSFVLDEVQIEIDEWPMIPPYLEVEWQSAEEVETMISKLWFSLEQTTGVDTEEVYKQHGIDLNTIPYLHF